MQISHINFEYKISILYGSFLRFLFPLYISLYKWPFLWKINNLAIKLHKSSLIKVLWTLLTITDLFYMFRTIRLIFCPIDCILEQFLARISKIWWQKIPFKKNNTFSWDEKSKNHFIQSLLYINTQLFYVTDFLYSLFWRSVVFLLTFLLFLSEFLPKIKKRQIYLKLTYSII